MNSIKNKMLSMVNIKDIETVVKAKMLLRKDAQINVEQYLEVCMQSLLHQTLEDIEIILVDDGTKDNCGIMCCDQPMEEVLPNSVDASKEKHLSF